MKINSIILLWLKLKAMDYNISWRNFIGAYECFIESLNNDNNNESEKQNAYYNNIDNINKEQNMATCAILSSDLLAEGEKIFGSKNETRIWINAYKQNYDLPDNISNTEIIEQIKIFKQRQLEKGSIYKQNGKKTVSVLLDDIILLNDGEKTSVINSTNYRFSYYKNMHYAFKPSSEYKIVDVNGETMAIRFVSEEFGYEYFNTNPKLYLDAGVASNGKIVDAYKNNTQRKTINLRQGTPQEIRNKRKLAIKALGIKQYDEAVSMVTDMYGDVIEMKREELTNRWTEQAKQITNAEQKAIYEKMIHDIQESDYEVVRYVGGSQIIFDLVANTFNSTLATNGKKWIATKDGKTHDVTMMRLMHNVLKTGYYENQTKSIDLNTDEDRKRFNELKERYAKLIEHFSIIASDSAKAIESNHRIVIRFNNVNDNNTDEQAENETSEQEDAPIREGWQISDYETAFADKLSDAIKRRLRKCVKTDFANRDAYDKTIGVKNPLPPYCTVQANSFGYPIRMTTGEAMNMVLQAVEGCYSPEEFMQAMENLYQQQPGIVDLYTELKESYNAQENDVYSDKGRFFTEFFHNCVNDNIHVMGVINDELNHTEIFDDELLEIIKNIFNNLPYVFDRQALTNVREHIDTIKKMWQSPKIEKLSEHHLAPTYYFSEITINDLFQIFNGLKYSGLDIQFSSLFGFLKDDIEKHNLLVRELTKEIENPLIKIENYPSDFNGQTEFRKRIKEIRRKIQELQTDKISQFVNTTYNNINDILNIENIFDYAKSINTINKKSDLYTNVGKHTKSLVEQIRPLILIRRENQYEYNGKTYYTHRKPTEIGRVFSALTHSKESHKRELIKRVMHLEKTFESEEDFNTFFADKKYDVNWIAIHDNDNSKWYVGRTNFLEIDRRKIEIERIRHGAIFGTHLDSIVFNPLLEEDNHLSLHQSVGVNMQEYGMYSELDAIKNMLLQYKGDYNDNVSYCQVPIPADGKGCYFFRGNKYSDNYMIRIIDREIERIRMVSNPNFKHKIKSFNENGKEFCYFPELNTLKLQLANGEKYTLLEALKFVDDQIKTKNISDSNSLQPIENVIGFTSINALKMAYINKVMENDFEATMKYWESIGLFEKDGNGNFYNLDNVKISSDNIQKVRNDLYEFYKFHVMNTANCINLLFGDVAFAANIIDFQKRFKQTQAPMMRCNTHAFYGRDIMRCITLSDEKMVSKTKSVMVKAISNYTNLSEIEKKAIINSINKINVTDGQGFRSFSSMRAVLDMTDKWSEQHEKAMERLKNGTWTMADLSVFMISLKPLYMGMDTEVDENGNVLLIPTDRKMSEAVLLSLLINTPNVQATSPILQGLAQFMEDNVIDVAYFNSATKVGERNVITSPTTENFSNKEQVINYLEKQTGLHNRPTKEYTNKEMREAANWDNMQSKMIQSHDYSQYGIQQEKPNHFIDTEQLFGTQLRKHIKADMPDNELITIGLGNERRTMTKRKWIDTYNTIVSTNIMDSFASLSDEFTNIESASQSLIKMMANDSEIDDDFFEALEVVETADGQKVFNLALADPILVNNMERKLNAMANKKITNQKVHGGSLVQVSCYGLEELEVVFEYTDEYGNIKEIRNSDVNMQNIDPKRLRVKYMECYMPVYDSKLLDYLVRSQGNVPVWRTDLIPEAVLKVLGYRIPTEDKYSIAPLKIKGFLNQNMGGSIMLPADITNISGSDFDIDVMYLMTPSIEFIEDDYQFALQELVKNPEYYEFIGKIATTKKIEELVKRYYPFVNKSSEDYKYYSYLTALYAILNKGIISKNKTISKIIKEFIGGNFKFPTIVEYDYSKHASEQSKAARDNALIELMHGAMTSPYMTDKFLNPGNFDELERLANIINLVYFSDNNLKDDNGNKIQLNDLYKYDLDTIKKLVKKTGLNGNGVSVLSPATYSYFYKQNSEGKEMTGVMAANAATHSILQQCKIETPNISMQTDERGNRHANKYYDEEFSQVSRDGSQKYISKICGMQVQAATDTAKNPTLSTCNINKYTSKFVNCLERAGFSVEDAVLITCQPIVKMMTNVYLNELSKTNDENYAVLIASEFAQNIKTELMRYDFIANSFDNYSGEWINIPAGELLHSMYIGRNRMTQDKILDLAKLTKDENNPDRNKIMAYLSVQMMCLGFFEKQMKEGNILLSVSSKFRSDRPFKGFASDVIDQERKQEKESVLHTLGNVPISVKAINNNSNLEQTVKELMFKKDGYVSIILDESEEKYPDLNTINPNVAIDDESILVNNNKLYGGYSVIIGGKNAVVYNMSDKKQRIALLTSLMGHLNDPIQTSFYYASIQSRHQLFDKVVPYFGERYKEVVKQLSDITGLDFDSKAMNGLFKEMSISMLCHLPQIANRRNYLTSYRDIQKEANKNENYTGNNLRNSANDNYLVQISNLDTSDKEASLYNFFHYCRQQEWFQDELKKGNKFLMNIGFIEDYEQIDAGEELSNYPAGSIIYRKAFLDTADDAKEVKNGWRNLFDLDNNDAKRLAVELWLHILNRGIGAMNGYAKYCPIEVRQEVDGYTDFVQKIMNESNEKGNTEIFDFGEFAMQYVRNHIYNIKNIGHYYDTTMPSTVDMADLTNPFKSVVNIKTENIINNKKNPISFFDKTENAIKLYPFIRVKVGNSYRIMAIDGEIISQYPNCTFKAFELQRMGNITYTEVKPLGYGFNTTEYFHGEGATSPNSPSIYDHDRQQRSSQNNGNDLKGMFDMIKEQQLTQLSTSNITNESSQQLNELQNLIDQHNAIIGQTLDNTPGLNVINPKTKNETCD